MQTNEFMEFLNYNCIGTYNLTKHSGKNVIIYKYSKEQRRFILWDEALFILQGAGNVKTDHRRDAVMG